MYEISILMGLHIGPLKQNKESKSIATKIHIGPISYTLRLNLVEYLKFAYPK